MAKRISEEEMRFSVVINGNEAQKELFELENATKKLSSTNKDLRAERTKLFRQGKKGTEEYKQLTAEINKNSLVITANTKRMDVLQKEIGLTGLSLNQLRRQAAILGSQLRNMIPGSAEYDRLQQELKATTSRIRELQAAARGATPGIRGIAEGFNRYAAMGASLIAAGTGMVLSIQKMVDYNGQLSDSQADVMKTTGMTKAQVDELTKSFGLMKTRTARIELLKLAEDAGRLGITGVKNLQDFVATANQLKVALGDDLSEEAIKEVGKMTNIYKVGEQTGRDFADSMLSLGSAINEVSASGANQAGFLVDYLKRQAGIAVQAKLGAAENIGYAATFDEIGQSVEISATAMNKIWMDLFEDTATYAKIAKMSLNDFNNLLQTDSNEAMIRFLEGLNGNNEGLSVMVEKLKDIDVGGARGAQALSALAGATGKLRERQALANQSLQEATSLTDEYNIKNNNLAATIDKVKKRMIGFFTSEAISGSLSAIITSFGKLIGAIEDVNEEFAEESKRSFEAAQANRKLADESNNLLQEYEDLTRDGIVPTADEKRRLEEITLQLKDRLGESVLMIDEETGAFKLNTEAVREQIKLKRLAADEEAATLASRLKGASEEIESLKKKNKPIEREYEIRKKYFERQNADDLKAIENSSFLSAMEKQQQKERLQGYAEMDKARMKLTVANDKVYEQELRRKDLLEKLKELNYTESDVDLMFPDQNTGDPSGPKEGETKIIGDQLYRFTGGKWVLQETSTGGPTSTGDPAADLKRKQAELRRIQEENNRLRASLISDAFQKELALEDANHQEKVARLKEQMFTEAELKGMSPEARQVALQQNKELNDQLLLEEEIHQNKIGAILQKGIEDQIATEQEAFDRETVRRETAHNLALASLGNNEEAKKRLQEQYQREEEQRQRDHLEKMINQMKEILSSVDFEGVNLDLLPPEEKQKILDWLDEANLKLSELLGKMGKSSGKTGGERIDGDVDFLGFSIDQWEQTFANLDTTAQKLEAAQVAVGALMNAWAMYSDFQRRREEVEMRNFERAQEKKQQDLKRNLDRGYINQRQYDKAVEALEQERRKKEAEMQYKQAKREKEMAVANIALNGAVAISKALAQGGFILGVPWAGIIAALTAIQLGMALATPLPAKGYEDGLYPVRREQDGKVFNAGSKKLRSGLVDKPTILVGERNKPEMVIDDRAWAKMDPAVKDSIYRELGRMGRVPGYEGGYYPEMRRVERSDTPGSSADYGLFVAALNRNSAVMEKIEKAGLQAYLVRDMENTKKIKDDLDDYNKLRNANKR